MMTLKPGGGLLGTLSRLQQFIDLISKRRIPQQLFDVAAGDTLQDGPRAVRELPQFGIELHPYPVGRVVPRPADVERQLEQRLDADDVGGHQPWKRAGQIASHAQFECMTIRPPAPMVHMEYVDLRVALQSPDYAQLRMEAWQTILRGSPAPRGVSESSA